jgi:hypothetical protein
MDSSQQPIPAGHSDFENTLTPEEAEEFDRMAAEQIAKQKVYVPPPVTGYRTLTQVEVDLMNEGKALAEQCGAFISKLRGHYDTNGSPVQFDLFRTEPPLDQRWVSIGATDLQRGFMAVIRGIAQPTTF